MHVERLRPRWQTPRRLVSRGVDFGVDREHPGRHRATAARRRCERRQLAVARWRRRRRCDPSGGGTAAFDRVPTSERLCDGRREDHARLRPACPACHSHRRARMARRQRRRSATARLLLPTQPRGRGDEPGAERGIPGDFDRRIRLPAERRRRDRRCDRAGIGAGQHGVDTLRLLRRGHGGHLRRAVSLVTVVGRRAAARSGPHPCR